MRNLFIGKLSLVVLLIVLAGCGSGGNSAVGGTGSIKATLEWGTSKGSSVASSLRRFFGIHSAYAPSGVLTVRIIVTGSDMTAIQQDFQASDGGGVINGVPAGNNRTVAAQGLDSNGNLAYQGSIGNVTVVSGQTTDVGTITMLPFATACLDLINQGEIVEARDACVNAATSYGNTVSNDADTARFFAAFSRMASLWYNMSSTGNANNGLNTLGDILDAFGCNASGRDPLHPQDLVCTKPLPSGAPTGAQLQTFIANVIEPELQGAISNLGSVSQSFNVTWTEPFGGKQVISDYGDVLTLKSAAEFLLGWVIVENSYNLDDNIANTVNTKQTMQAFLASNPNFLTLVDASQLPTAQSIWGSSSQDTLAAISWMQSRTSSQSNYFISLASINPSKINKFIKAVNELNTTLTGPYNIYDDKTGNLDAIFNLSKFFTGLNLRSLLPSYSGNHPTVFPDPTFDGIWTSYIPGSPSDPDVFLHKPKKHGAFHSGAMVKSGVVKSSLRR